MGTPPADRATVSAVPETRAVLIVDVPADPLTTDTAFGDAPIEKSFVATTPQPGSLNEAMRVFQLNVPFVGMYSLVYQNVQSSTGSMSIWL